MNLQTQLGIIILYVFLSTILGDAKSRKPEIKPRPHQENLKTCTRSLCLKADAYENAEKEDGDEKGGKGKRRRHSHSHNPDEKNNDPSLKEGDIIPGWKRNALGNGRFRNAMAIDYYDDRWTNGVVPYVISEAYTDEEKQVIISAMEHIEMKTQTGTQECIKFVQRTNEIAYLEIKKAPGCSSYIGNAWWLDAQPVNLDVYCIAYGPGVAIHEFLHALGFFHEHSRTDRDQYITINFENVNPDKTSNFDIATDSHNYEPYDYASIMHYGPDAFPKQLTTGHTIEAKDSSKTALIGQRLALSNKDVREIQKLYDCPVTDATDPPMIDSFCTNEVSDTLCGFVNLNKDIWTRLEITTKTEPTYELTYWDYYKGTVLQMDPSIVTPGSEGRLQLDNVPANSYCFAINYFLHGSNGKLDVYVISTTGIEVIVYTVQGPVPDDVWYMKYVTFLQADNFSIGLRGTMGSTGGILVDDINLFTMPESGNCDDFLV